MVLSALSLKESQAVGDLAAHLYDFLPGKPHPYGSKQLSFPAVATQVGLAQYWQGGSKLPALTLLLQAALERERGTFCPLVLGIVRAGITYRKKNNPVTYEDVEQLNGILLRLGYKLPDLQDTQFLEVLPKRNSEESCSTGQKAITEKLGCAFNRLHTLEAQPRGFAFEVFLSDLFSAFGMAPRGSFRLVGEQIDGSFRLHTEFYLLEARWRNAPTNNADLLAFSGKVGGKANWSRGLFVSYAGFASDGLEAFTRGRQTNIVCVDGLDLHHVLSGKLDFREVLERKVRRAAETNRAFVPVRELFPGLT